MKINFTRLIQESGRSDRLTKKIIARALAEADFCSSVQSGEQMIQNLENGKAKSIKFNLITFLAEYFHCTGKNIIEWDEPTISEVSTHIRDDAPGLKNLKQ